jgi:uncharacterized protein
MRIRHGAHLLRRRLLQGDIAHLSAAQVGAPVMKGGQEQQGSGSLLDSMRDAVLGRSEPRGSVPSVHSQAQSSPTMAPPNQRQPGYPPQTPGPGLAPGMGPAFGSGGSFLGTAASTAAGVIGGGLLLNSIRSMFGEHAGLGGHEHGGLGSSCAADN